MKKLFILTVLFCGSYLANAQYATVVLDYEKSVFNEGKPLPAETYFILQGEVPADVNIVGATIQTADDDKVLHRAIWKRAEGNEGNTFHIPITYSLRSSGEYDVRINYYKNIDAGSSEELRQQLFTYLDSYVDQAVVIERNRIRLNEPAEQIVKSLNKIVEKSTLYYDNQSSIDFPGFSDLVTKSLRNVKNKPLSKGKFSLFKRKDDTDRNLKTEYAQEQIGSLKELIHSEVNGILNTELLTVYNSKEITNYPTEKLRKPLTVNVGYGAVYFEGNADDLSYDSAPYVGISFPLGNETFTSKFLSRTTLSAGIFLADFRNAENERISGPVVNKPIYAALGYPIFEFIRINAGVTVLQNSSRADSGVNLEQVTIKPFIGASVDINLWLGIGGRNKLRDQ